MIMAYGALHWRGRRRQLSRWWTRRSWRALCSTVTCNCSPKTTAVDLRRWKLIRWDKIVGFRFHLWAFSAISFRWTCRPSSQRSLIPWSPDRRALPCWRFALWCLWSDTRKSPGWETQSALMFDPSAQSWKKWKFRIKNGMKFLKFVLQFAKCERRSSWVLGWFLGHHSSQRASTLRPALCCDEPVGGTRYKCYGPPVKFEN